MRIFLDTNVILDYITNRAAFGEDAEAVVEFCRMDGNEGAFSSRCGICVLARSVGHLAPVRAGAAIDAGWREVM